eukprot:jgi/Psemu1/314362/fgenesh1_kg.1497_\
MTETPGQSELQASEIVTIKNQECLEISDPLNHCMMAREEMMKAEDSMVFCECRSISEEGDYMLICSIYDSYEYCASGSDISDDVCATVLFGQKISQYGAVTSDFRRYDVKMGDSSEQILVVDRSKNECSVFMNGRQCSKCNTVQCDNNTINDEEDILSIASAVGVGTNVFSDLSVDCSNVLGGETATFECGRVGEEDDNNLLSIFVGGASPVDAIGDNEAVSTKPQTIPPNVFPPTLPPSATLEPSASTGNSSTSSPPPLSVNNTVENTINNIDAEDKTNTTIESNESSGASWGLWQPQALRQTAFWVVSSTLLVMGSGF